MSQVRRLIIAVDCDDVLLPTAPAIIEAYNDTYGTSLDLTDFYSKDPKKWDVVDIREASDRVGMFLLSDNADIAPEDSTIQAIQDLSRNHELHLVTGRNQSLEGLTVDMINRYFAGCFTSIELTNFYDDNRRRTKGEVCQELNADILVDDHIEHINSVLESGLKEVIVFGDYPWNQVETLPAGAKRCRDWQEVSGEIERIAKQ